MQVMQYKMHVKTYDTDHGYWKEMVRENVSYVFISCQFSYDKCGLEASIVFIQCHESKFTLSLVSNSICISFKLDYQQFQITLLSVSNYIITSFKLHYHQL